jgi:hypothetical protein
MKKNMLYSVALVGSLFVNTAFAQVFVSVLNPLFETPPIDDSGMGGLAVGIATLNDDGSSSVLIIVSAFDNDTDITAAHIHRGEFGVAGPIICPIFTEGTWSNPMMATCNFDADQTGALFEGNLYTNVHTVAHGGGEIRDQLNFVQ